MITLQEFTVGERRARVWLGGRGEPLLLVHGGWGGAALHWSKVWEALAEHFRVIAPELPGIGDLTAPGLPTVDAYAAWLAALLEPLGARHAWCAGNSLGAAIAWQLSGLLGAGCRGLVLVNGPPPQAAPPAIRALAAVAPGWFLRALYRRLSFSPPVLARAFADATRAPSALTRVLADPPATQLDNLLELIAHGARPAPRPEAPILLAWGAADGFPGTTAADARRLQRRLGARMVWFADAGHCPQLEQPAQFTEALVAFGSAGRVSAAS